MSKLKFKDTFWENRYFKFIRACQDTKKNYTEKHHIIPTSLDGDNNPENIIKLSAREHFIAHYILAKGTNLPQMIKALHKMIYSTTGDVKRDYKISSRVYQYLRIAHSKVVSDYSKNTVTAKQIFTNEIKRIPLDLFYKYKDVLYVSPRKGCKDSYKTKVLKSKASQKPRKVKQGTRVRSLAATLYQYNTPKGFCETGKDVFKLYPTFTKSTLQLISNNAIISCKFSSIHKDFKPFIGKTFHSMGFNKIRKLNV